jgi:hypothetical protein
MDKIFNWDLFKNPLNWAIILSFVLIGGIALHFGLSFLKGSPVAVPKGNAVGTATQ